jgi:hypothetical protein
MFTCFTKRSSVINLDLLWKQVFSYKPVHLVEVGDEDGEVLEGGVRERGWGRTRISPEKKIGTSVSQDQALEIVELGPML